MSKRMQYVLAVCSLAVAGCATQQVPSAQFNAPVAGLPDVPRLTHAEKLANPPHPFLLYEDYEMEPRGFIFRPRPAATDENNTDNGDTGDAGAEDTGNYLDLSGGVLMGGPPGGG